jgi:hypothetical protein
MKYFVIFLILIGFLGFGFALGEEISHSMASNEEHYKIEIMGLKDEYTVGEEYSFSFVISGYGHSCANYQASYPDENGNIIHVGAEVLCAPEKSMHEFKFNPLDGKEPLGNTGIKKPGTYTISVTFEKPNKYYPTTISKEFRVVESITENFNELPPLKQIKAGIAIDEIQCKTGLERTIKINDFKRFYCMSPDTKQILIKRGWAFDESKACRNPINCFDSGISLDKTIHPEPKPQLISESETQLFNARKALESSYYENISLGPLKFNDAIVGFGIENDTLIMDVLYRYSTSSEMDIVKKKIRDIVVDEIKIEYVPFKTPPSVIEMAMPYHWNEYLHKNNIEFVPANTSYANNDEGIGNGTMLCSPLVAPNGTEFYIASTVAVEPFVITETFIDQEKPEFCRKTWKTDVILEEPNRVISLWLAMGEGRIPN